MSEERKVSVRGLTRRFGANTVLHNLNLELEPGSFTALLGRSGSGKTTLLRQMLGLEHPARGSVQVFGEDINRLPGRRRQQLRARWGMLFQHGALFSALTAFDNVAQPMRELRHLPEDLVRDAALLKLDMVGITPRDALKMPSDLSGGMVKRVALARALALEPELLFLDEPTAGLDPDLSDSFVALIAGLHRQLKLTVVMVTHDLDTLFALSTRIAVLSDKRVIAADTPERIVALPHPFVERFFLGGRGLRAMEVLREKNLEQDHGK